MNIVCIPVADDRGLMAPVAAGLDAAPVLLLVETASLAYRAVPNEAARRAARGCHRCAALDDTTVDAVLVPTIDGATLDRFSRRGIPVFGGASGSAVEALSAYMAGRLGRLFSAG